MYNFDISTLKENVTVKTEKLYEKNSYCKEFTATVLSCEYDGEYWYAVLDKTAFFPEGGGQAADCGTINGVDVLDVQITDGIITHKLAGEILVGNSAEGKINWDIRFARMQNHSGEHIVSGIVHSLFEYNNVGFHMSKAEMTVDFDGVLSATDIERVERLANDAVYRNLSIIVSYPSGEEEKELSYRSKLENIENLRLVTIEDTDCCACCAPHVSRTGEIGIIKIIDCTPNKGGVRLTVAAGNDALRDYAMLNASNKKLMKTLSVPRMLVADAAEKQLEEINALRFENKELLKRLAWAELDAVSANGCTYAFLQGVSYDELRHCSNLLSEEGKAVCMLFSTDDNENYIYVVSSKEHDTKPIVKALNETFSGKGGGRPNYAQGKIVSDSKEKIIAFIERKFEGI